MDKSVVSILVFPLLFAALFVQFRIELLHLLKKKLLDGVTNHYDMVIAVVSAREHFLQRQAIRDTWWGHVQSNAYLKDRVEMKFIVGQMSCPIPEVDRENIYSCERWNISNVSNQGEVLAVEEETAELSSEADHQINWGSLSLPFQVQHPVILSKLGIHRESVYGKMTVRLLDAGSQMEIVSTVLSTDSPGLLLKGFRYKAVEPYLLPKGFEGIITIEGPDASSREIPVSTGKIQTPLNTAGGVIKYFPPEMTYPMDGHYTDPVMWKANQLTVASFIYAVHEPEKLQSFIASRATRDMEYWVNRTELETQLLTEAQQHGDIIFVDAIDVYRNIPVKLAKFYQWVHSERRFDLLLKTDDDCYLDVEKILNSSTPWRHMSNIWWSRFRNNWVVEHYGKWAETEYSAPAYPRFACGSGGVLGSELVAWLAHNADTLNMYQGEDVSLGIWLASIAPHFIDDPHWQCERECLSSMYSMPDLNPSELRRTWSNRLTCGDPCGCD